LDPPSSSCSVKQNIDIEWQNKPVTVFSAASLLPLVSAFLPSLEFFSACNERKKYFLLNCKKKIQPDKKIAGMCNIYKTSSRSDVLLDNIYNRQTSY
jgi:hypothetical protein